MAAKNVASSSCMPAAPPVYASCILSRIGAAKTLCGRVISGRLEAVGEQQPRVDDDEDAEIMRRHRARQQDHREEVGEGHQRLVAQAAEAGMHQAVAASMPRTRRTAARSGFTTGRRPLVATHQRLRRLLSRFVKRFGYPMRCAIPRRWFL